MTINISKDQATVLKGIAILFMILHHCLIKEFYVDQPAILSTFPALRMQIGMKMCVGIYTFIISYGFWYCCSYSTKYVLEHIWKLLKYYWIILFLLIVPISIWGCFGGYKLLIPNMFGLQSQYNLGNWYIYFYVYALLVLPLLKRWLSHEGIWRLIVVIAVFGILTTIFSTSSILVNCFRYSQVLAVGLFCAKTQVLSKWSDKINSIYLWIAIALFAVALRCGIKGVTTDVIAVPFFIIAVCGIFQEKENTYTFRILTQLGKCSTYM